MWCPSVKGGALTLRWLLLLLLLLLTHICVLLWDDQALIGVLSGSCLRLNCMVAGPPSERMQTQGIVQRTVLMWLLHEHAYATAMYSAAQSGKWSKS